MESIKLVARNGEAVRAALERGEVLHLDTARVLGALGYSVEVLEEGAGLSGQGTGKDQRYRGDVLRKLLGKAEKQAEVRQEDRAWATSGGTAVKGRKCVSRRAAKAPDLDEADAAARSAAVGRSLLDWYNQTVGPRVCANRCGTSSPYFGRDEDSGGVGARDL